MTRKRHVKAAHADTDPLSAIETPSRCLSGGRERPAPMVNARSVVCRFPAGLPQTQALCLQTLLPLHRLPHPPQLASSVLRLTQSPPQLVGRVAGQHFARALPAQSPLHPAQTDPVAHALPQLPQLASSVLTLVQVPPQFC